MTDLSFEWDSRKASANRNRHGVSFEEAKSAFLDENARVIEVRDHSDEEERFILLGLSIRLRVLVVVRCYRESADVIRIYRLVERIGLNERNTQTFCYEEDIRLFEISKKSLSKESKEAADHPARRRYH